MRSRLLVACWLDLMQRLIVNTGVKGTYGGVADDHDEESNIQ